MVSGPYYTGTVNRYTLIATATFGLESVVGGELASLGYTGVSVENGRAVLSGSDEDVARLNLWLRSADRVLIRLAEFPARTLDDVYEGVRSITWPDFLPRTPKVVVTAHAAHGGAKGAPAARAGHGKSSRPVHGRRAAPAPRDKSLHQGFGVPALQSVGKKAIVDSLMRARHITRVEETGPLYPVAINVSAAGTAMVTLDTSGSGLHKRGYRTEAGEAPIRETLAAGMVLLSKWDPSRPFVDPLCGSGTIPIEAALIGANAAPGAHRDFAAEAWPHFPPSVFRQAREEASAARKRIPMDIRGSDRDAGLVAAAERNAGRAGAVVRFSRAELRSLRLHGEYGCIVTNPPYGERIGEERETEELYTHLGDLFRSLPTWSLFALSAHPRFSVLFGARPTKNRKLYNGNIRCYFHEYYGPLPV